MLSSIGGNMAGNSPSNFAALLTKARTHISGNETKTIPAVNNRPSRVEEFEGVREHTVVDLYTNGILTKTQFIAAKTKLKLDKQMLMRHLGIQNETEFFREFAEVEAIPAIITQPWRPFTFEEAVKALWDERKAPELARELNRNKKGITSFKYRVLKQGVRIHKQAWYDLIAGYPIEVIATKHSIPVWRVEFIKLMLDLDAYAQKYKLKLPKLIFVSS